eukprot:Rmarinus@m.27818
MAEGAIALTGLQSAGASLPSSPSRKSGVSFITAAAAAVAEGCTGTDIMQHTQREIAPSKEGTAFPEDVSFALREVGLAATSVSSVSSLVASSADSLGAAIDALRRGIAAVREHTQLTSPSSSSPCTTGKPNSTPGTIVELQRTLDSVLSQLERCHEDCARAKPTMELQITDARERLDTASRVLDAALEIDAPYTHTHRSHHTEYRAHTLHTHAHKYEHAE